MNTIITHNRQKQQGLSMVELMVTLLISSLLMLGVFEIFLSSNQNNRYAHANARVQENGRLALDILTRNLRMAGYQGCIDPDLISMNIIANDPPTTDLSGSGVMGYESDDSSWDIGTRDSQLDGITGVPNGSDIIFVQFVSPTGVNVMCTGSVNSCTSVNANVKINNNSIGLTQNDIAVVTDCESADMFRIVNMPFDASDGMTTLAHSNSQNTSNNLSKPYNDKAQVLTFNAFAYYVKNTGRTNERGDAIFSLYQFDTTYQTGGVITGKEDELVEGVEQLQILYGQRLSSGNTRYVPADDSSLDFAEVETIRLSILVSDSDPIRQDDDNKTYKLSGADVDPAGTGGAETTHPADRRLRQTFTTTLYMRNLG